MLDISAIASAIVRGFARGRSVIANEQWELVVGDTRAAMQVKGAMDTVFPVQTLTDATLLEDVCKVLLVNNQQAAPITITLPASPGVGQQLIIKDVNNAGTHNVTVDGNGNDIDTAGTFVLSADRQNVHLVSDGTDWWVIT